MALLTEQDARANLRVRDGQRVLYLAKGDHLTPSARDWLAHERISIIPVEQSGKADGEAEYQTVFGAVLREKPEHMTHLYGNVLVPKDHPRIHFRGMIDTLEAELLLCQQSAETAHFTSLAKELQEMLDFVRGLIPCDVLGKPLGELTLCGLDAAQLREQSHHPEQYFGQPHFMPSAQDSQTLLLLNRVRTVVRQTELAAYAAFRDENGAVTRNDLILALNRLSSLCWIQMCKLKAGRYTHG
jgi:ethanolamine utilization cobalamin adenosyltransferase